MSQTCKKVKCELHQAYRHEIVGDGVNALKKGEMHPSDEHLEARKYSAQRENHAVWSWNLFDRSLREWQLFELEDLLQLLAVERLVNEPGKPLSWRPPMSWTTELEH